MTTLQPGDMAPDFKSTTQAGETLTLADLRGQRTILLLLSQGQHLDARSKPKSLRDGKEEPPARDSASSA